MRLQRGEQAVLGPKSEAWLGQWQAVSSGSRKRQGGRQTCTVYREFGLRSAGQERTFSGLKMRVILGARKFFQRQLWGAGSVESEWTVSGQRGDRRHAQVYMV